ncbi:hypothetical protein [Enterococcus timonensis]|nr:hypothetical protein [Enterococcus timonensis]
MKKRGLAAIHPVTGVIKLRRTQAIAYLSLLTNAVAVTVIIIMWMTR